ncbi:MAG TPA: response regulator [Myxococcaceae bacterium]|nr:response regulator [Myxococcaceae bacterium]
MTDPTTLLIADDDGFVRLTLKDALGNKGYHFLEARDGVEAVSACAEKAPSLVLLDLMMPNKSGLEALTELRERHPHLRILVMSSLDSDSLVQQALDAGAVGFVVKPFHPLEIAGAVEKALAA